MLTLEQIEEVKQEFIDRLKEIERPDCDIEGLIAYLDASGFFQAPASTEYHCSFPGGLALHSLNVYYALKELNDVVAKLTEDDSRQYSKDSLIIVGLLHDLGKINYYEEYVKNEKVYNKYGKKSDELGTFDWVSTRSYRVKEGRDREILGTKGFTSYYIASNFISLSKEEMVTLTNQYSAIDREPLNGLSNILANFNLAVLLHSADIIATYCIEK